MEALKTIGKTFLYILAGITLSTALFITLFFPEAELTVSLLWQIIIMAAVCVLGNLFYYTKKEFSKSQMRLRIRLHYLYVNAIVIIGAYLWKWITPGYLMQFLALIILIAGVYIMVMLINFKQEEKTAERLNQRLHKIHEAEEKKEK